MNTLKLLGELEANLHLDRFVIRRHRLAAKHLRPLVEAVVKLRSEYIGNVETVERARLLEDARRTLAALHTDLLDALQ